MSGRTVEVRTQAQLDKALKTQKPGDVIVCLGGTWNEPLRAYGSATVRAYGSATVRAYGSATVWAYDSATVRASGSATVRAYGSATVEASGSATVRAYDSATVRASDSATVEASDSATVEASGSAAVRKMPNGQQKITGGIVIDVPDLSTLTPQEWCDYYGVTVTRGRALLYKAVDDDYSTTRARVAGLFYTPGAKVEAPDWNDVPACGGGLHVSPRPFMARRYNEQATRYVQVKAPVKSLVVIDDKAKAPRLSVVCEVTEGGEPL